MKEDTKYDYIITANGLYFIFKFLYNEQIREWNDGVLNENRKQKLTRNEKVNLKCYIIIFMNENLEDHYQK